MQDKKWGRQQEKSNKKATIKRSKKGDQKMQKK